MNVSLFSKEYILQNAVNQTVDIAIDFHSMGGKNTMEVNGYRQLFGYQHSWTISA